MALVDPNIAMSFRMPEFRPRNALAEYAQIQQIQGGQRQAEVADMQLESLRRDRDALSQIQAAIVAKGGPPDLLAAADEMIKTGKPEYIAQGQSIRDRFLQQQAFAQYQSEFAPKAPGASPTGMDLPAGDQPPTNGLMGRVAGVSTTPVPDAAPMNAMAPAPAASVNAMAGKPDVAALEARYRRVSNIDTPGAKAEAALLLKQIEAAAKEPRLYVVPGVGLTSPTGQVVKPSVATPTELQRNFEFAKTPAGGNFKGSLADFKVLSTPKSTTNISLSTEKKYGETFAGKIADIDAAKLTTAEKAPQLAESANRIIDIVSRGDVFTGPAADIKLNIARALNVAGANNQERIANTEQLIASTGQSTLDAIKSAGLGTGQGFTDKDLKFLQGIAGGTIGLTAQTLTELATLQHRAATRAVDAWGKRVKEIPKDALAGTGISTEPIKVPPLASVMKRGVGGIPQAAIDDLKKGLGTDAQFDQQFGPGAAARARGAK